MKIAILGTRYSPPHFRGGEERYLFYLDQYLTKRGHSVDVYTPKFRKWQKYDTASTANNVTRVPVSNIRFFYHFQFARRLPSYLKREDYDVVINTHNPLGHNLKLRPHIVMIATTCIGEAQAAKGRSFLKILERFMRRTFSLWVESKVAKQCSHLICVNRHIQDEVVRYFGVPREKTTFIGVGVDSDRYRPLREDSPKANSSWRILYVGRLVNRKNVELLVRAAVPLQSAGIDFVINTVGEGEERGKLESLSRELGVEDRVVFLGRQTEEELLSRYQNSNVFVLPSRYEGMPSVILEALSCGLPVVVGNFKGASDIIKNDFNGYVLEGNSPSELALRLRQINQDQALAHSMSQNARQLIIESFSWEGIIDQLIQVIEKVKKTDK